MFRVILKFSFELFRVGTVFIDSLYSNFNPGSGTEIASEMLFAAVSVSYCSNSIGIRYFKICIILTNCIRFDMACTTNCLAQSDVH